MDDLAPPHPPGFVPPAPLPPGALESVAAHLSAGRWIRVVNWHTTPGDAATPSRHRWPSSRGASTP